VEREALEDAAPPRGSTTANPSQVNGILPPARLTQVLDPLPENPFVCGYVIRGAGQRGQQLVPSLYQIRGIGNGLPIVLPSVPEAETSDPLVAGPPSSIPNVGQLPSANPLEALLSVFRLAADAS
jgi:hypothetical protein